MFSMSPEGWEKLGDEAKGSPEATASQFERGGAEALREDYFADLDPLKQKDPSRENQE